MTELRIIARCALILAGSLACAAAGAQAPAPSSAAASSAADRAQKETDRTLYWIRVLAEKPAPKATPAKPAAVAAAPQAAKPAAVAAAPQAERVKVAQVTSNATSSAAEIPPANPATSSVVVAAPAATAPSVTPSVAPPAGRPGNTAAMAASGGLDAGVAAPALAGALAAPALTPTTTPDVAPAPEVEEPDPGLIMTRSADPQFPMNVMKRLRKGEVEVRFEVGSDGQVDVVSVVKTTNPGLNDAALDAVRQWQFKPTPHGHTAVVDLAFNLDA